MSSHEAAEPAPPSRRRQEPPVLFQTRVPLLPPSTVGYFIAEDAAKPHIGERLFDDVERARDGVRRRVVVKQKRRPAFERFQSSRQSAVVHGLVVQGPVQLPPEAAEDLEKILRLPPRRVHPACEARIQVRMGADHAGNDDLPPEIDRLLPRDHLESIASLRDTLSIDPEVTLPCKRRIERHEKTVLQERSHPNVLRGQRPPFPKGPFREKRFQG